MKLRLDPPPLLPRWRGETVIVAASGPSLTEEVAAEIAAARARGAARIVAVNDAYRRLACADVLYACDGKWWDHHHSDPKLRAKLDAFGGEKWSSHGSEETPGKSVNNDKQEQFVRWRLHVASGKNVDGFSFDPACIHYGTNSGHQAVNLAGLWNGWEAPILLAGFDMRKVDSKDHFFGDHPKGFNSNNYSTFIAAFEKSAKLLPAHVRVINCTKDSALTCFPCLPLGEALAAAPEACAA